MYILTLNFTKLSLVTAYIKMTTIQFSFKSTTKSDHIRWNNLQKHWGANENKTAVRCWRLFETLKNCRLSTKTILYTTVAFPLSPSYSPSGVCYMRQVNNKSCGEVDWFTTKNAPGLISWYWLGRSVILAGQIVQIPKQWKSADAVALYNTINYLDLISQEKVASLHVQTTTMMS